MNVFDMIAQISGFGGVWTGTRVHRGARARMHEKRKQRFTAEKKMQRLARRAQRI